MAGLFFEKVEWDDVFAEMADMSSEAKHAYMMLRAWGWRRECALPNDDDRLRRLAEVSPRVWQRIKSEVLEPFQEDENGKLYHPKQRALWEEIAKKSVNACKNGALGGKAKANKNNGSDVANGTEPLDRSRYRLRGREEDSESYTTDRESISDSQTDTNTGRRQDKPAHVNGSNGHQELSLFGDDPPPPDRIEFPPKNKVPKERGRYAWPAEFRAFCEVYPFRDTDSAAAAYQHWRRIANDPDIGPLLLVEGAKRYRAHLDADGKAGEFSKKVETWINAEGWAQPYRIRSQRRQPGDLTDADQIRYAALGIGTIVEDDEPDGPPEYEEGYFDIEGEYSTH